MEKGGKIAIATSVLTTIGSAIAAVFAFVRRSPMAGLLLLIGGFLDLENVGIGVHCIYAVLIGWIYYILYYKK